MSLFAKAKGLATDFVTLEKDEAQVQREIVEQIEEEQHGWGDTEIELPDNGDQQYVENGDPYVGGHATQDVAYDEQGVYEAQNAEAYDMTQEQGGWDTGYDPVAYGAADQSGWEGAGDVAEAQDPAQYSQWEAPVDTAEYPPPATEPYVENVVAETAIDPPVQQEVQPAADTQYSVPSAIDGAKDGDAEAEGSGALSKVARLSKRVKDQQQKIMRMEQQAFLDGQKIHDLREALAKKDTEMASTLTTLEFNKKELASLKAEAAEICKGAVLNWQIRAEQAERALDEAQRNLKQRENECTALRQDLEDAEEGFRKKTERLQEEIKEVRQEAESLKKANAKLEHAYSEATQQAEERADEVRRLQEDLWRKQEDILTLQRQNQELGEAGLQAKYRVKLEEAERCHKRALDVMTQKMLQEVEQLKQELEQVNAEKEQLIRHQEDFRTFLKPSMRGISRASARSEPAATAAELKPAPQPSAETELAVKWDYLRGILVQFLQNSDPAFRRRLLPILATVLHLDHYELQAIYIANRQWVVEPEFTGCGTFFSSFLRPVAR